MITTTVSLCSGSTTGTITIDPADDLSLISAVGTDSQVICEGDSINNIIYQFSGGATSANITGLPPGVSFAITTDLVTISGTPSAVSNPTVYTYTVTTTGPCDSAILSGTITVNPDDELVLTSAVGTDSQVLCEGDAIDNITYLFYCFRFITSSNKINIIVTTKFYKEFFKIIINFTTTWCKCSVYIKYKFMHKLFSLDHLN